MLRLLLALIVATGAVAVSATPSLTIRNSFEKPVSVLSDAQKAYFALPREVRIERMTNAVARAETKKLTTLPKGTWFKWRWKDDVPRSVQFRVRVTREANGSVFFEGLSPAACPDRIYLENLEIATVYRLTVAAVVDGDEVASDSKVFETESVAPRFIRVDGVPSFRDLGGRVGLDGRRVRQGLLFRSTGFNENTVYPKEGVPKLGRDRITDAGRLVVTNVLCIKTDLDIRNDKETYLMSASPIGPSVTWLHLPAASYAGCFMDKFRERFPKIFKALCNRERYPVVFHCIAGADRTGTIAFILNGLLGVEEDLLWQDWEINAFFDGNLDFKHRDRIAEVSRLLHAFPGATLAEKCENFAKSRGITQEEIDTFRNLMLGSVPNRVSGSVPK